MVCVCVCESETMSGGKKRSGFQITSVTSDRTPAGKSSPSVVQTVLQSEVSSYSHQGSSSQPTTPSLKRKHISHDALGQGVESSPRFRVVRLVVGGTIKVGDPYRCGRWICTDSIGQQEVSRFRRVTDCMRNAHSLESLEMMDQSRAGVHSQDTAHLLTRPSPNREAAGLTLTSGPPSPTHTEPISTQVLDQKQPMGGQHSESPLLLPLLQPRNTPPPLEVDVAAARQPGLRLPYSQPFSPPARPNHPSLTPTKTPTFSLDNTVFNLPGNDSTSNNSVVAIDNKIEQAMDLVKSHLMMAVREEVELLREQIRELQEKNKELLRENNILRTITHSH